MLVVNLKHKAMNVSISMESIVGMIAQLKLSKKKWLVKELQAQIKQEEEDRILLESSAMQESLDDIRNGRTTEYKNSQELFDKFGI